MESHRKSARFDLLDGMRGLAALAVISDHVSSATIEALLPGRYLAVDFFFVLSGFVLAHAYSARLQRGGAWASFIMARIVRLYPLYLLGAALGGALIWLHIAAGWNTSISQSQLWTSALLALFMLPCPPQLSLWPGAPYPLNGPSWSLFFELVANAVMGVLGRNLTPRVCLALMALGAVGLVPTSFYFGQLDGGFDWANFVAGFPRVIFSFFAGVWIYHSGIYARVRALPAWAAAAALAGVFMVPADGVWRSAFDLLAVLAIFPLLVTFCAGTALRGPVRALASTIGLLSYGVYILHVPLWGWLKVIMSRYAIEAPGYVDVGIAVVAALSVAAVADAVYDKPVRRWLSGLSAGRS